MIALLQRVTEASVQIEAQRTAEIANGLLVFIGVERDDTASRVDRLLERVLGYRIFADAQGRMNLSVSDISGGLLLVPQFTLVADTSTGTRPGFSTAAEPATGRRWFEFMVEAARRRHHQVASGSFGADMQIFLVNDGPVTFWLQS
ncbi:MAG: D-aminoacyl-tRNA deacylase [Thiogranum sp.]|nr:D-aminoacyl-tRNA deacylase [Thiogranum sp.]